MWHSCLRPRPQTECDGSDGSVQALFITFTFPSALSTERHKLHITFQENRQKESILPYGFQWQANYQQEIEKFSHLVTQEVLSTEGQQSILHFLTSSNLN